MSLDPQRPVRNLKSPAVWIATGLGIGLITPGVPGTVGAAVWGLPLAWAISELPGIGWRLVAIAAVNVVGIPLATAAGRALGGEKDHQAIVLDEVTTVPVVFSIVPLVNWQLALLGFVLHRIFDIIKPPPARQLESLPEGLGVMADDWMASVYACAALTGFAWIDRAAGSGLLTSGG